MNKTLIAQSKPTIGGEELLAVGDVLKSGQLAMGPAVRAFENKFCSLIGTRYACAVNSGTSALHLALLAIGVKAGDEVIIPSYSCTALLNAVWYAGATPVPADIDERSFCISREDAERRITSSTKAIIAVHTFGAAADISALRSTGIDVIEDCAHSLGGFQGSKKMGSIGTAAVYSFYPTKMMTTGEGGMITTSSESVFRFVTGAREYDMPEKPEVRFNYKMTDIAAAIGLAQLEKLDGFIARRRYVAERYNKLFTRCRFVTVPERDLSSDVVYRYILLFSDSGRAGDFIEAMNNSGIVCDRPVFRPLHSYLGLPDSGFPVASDVFARAVSIPVYPSLSDGDIERIIEECGKFFTGEVTG